MRSIVQTVAVAAALIGLAACSGTTTSGVPPTTPSQQIPAGVRDASASAVAPYSLPANVSRACEPSKTAGIAHCLALVRNDVHALRAAVSGYGPSDLQSAYELPSSTQGVGQTVAIVDAYDDPNAATDLATYRSNFALPACNTSNPCFTKVNEQGQQGPYPTANSGWAVEMSLDVDMVSAICPNCNIILVEASTSSLTDLGKSVDEAIKLGATVVSNSYIGYGAKGAHGEKFYDHAGIIMTAGGGDDGYGIGEPAGFPGVVAVGGTTLQTANNTRGWSETVWGGTGSGCEKKLAKPTWQTDAGCKGRTMDDVAAVADPQTGVAVYDTYHEAGWIEVGGTSVATPVIGGVYALAGNATSLNAAQSLYASGASLWDVTTGNDGSCKAKVAYLCTGEVGYDGPTGNGTPNGVSAF